MIVQQLIPIGILIIFIGIIILFVGFILSATKQKQTKTEGGFIFWVGPIPFGFATRKEIFYALLAASVILILAFLFFNRKF